MANMTQAEKNAQVAQLKTEYKALKESVRKLSKDSDEFRAGKAKLQELHAQIEEVRATPVAEEAAA